MKKVGRNDPCPCGSGEKFKKCCIDIYGKDYRPPTTFKEEEKSKFSEYLSEHETGHVLNLVTAFQLIPENQGKNIRIEQIAAKAVKNLSAGKPGDYKKLQSILSNEYSSHHFEDPPEELFTENVLFHGGNFIVMPGINSYCVDIFKYLTESIYTTKNNISKKLKDEIYKGVSLLLNIGNTLFNQANLTRNVFVENLELPLEFPENLPRLSFNKSELAFICKENRIPPSIIDRFITESNEPNLDDPYLSPLLHKPFVTFEDEYFMVLPSCQVSAINNYILTAAKAHNTLTELHELCHKRIWRDVWQVCDKMGWVLTDITLPDKAADHSVIEGIFQFDAYMLAYVCYSFPSELKSTSELYSEQTPDLFSGHALNARTEEVITALKKREEFKGFQFLTLVLNNAMGGALAMGIEGSQEFEQKTYFNVFDFLNLGYNGEWGRLDLWKFAKVHESSTQVAQIMATSSIDAYATYKSKGESFYFSDDARYDFVTVVPGTGADFTRESKIELDVHGALSLINGSLAYQSVRRFREYAPIYTPVRPRVPYEMLLESYSFPIWVQNHQAQSQTEAGFVEHIADAICFWLDRLYPALSQQLHQPATPVLNIVLEFDQTYFNPLPLERVDSPQVIDPTLKSSYSEGILTIGLPKHIRQLFVGGDNSGERIFMTEILKALGTIPNISFSDQYIEESIDKHIPLGLAKMILMIDTRTDLQLDNRWLLPTLYISDAEINLLLDDLVGIINHPEPIPEKFESVADKKAFCNHTVLKLVQHLIVKLSEFNGEELINRLIKVNEHLVHNREFSKLKTSAQIHCFGNDEKELEKIFESQSKLVNTSLATRCLIEFVTLVPVNGDRKPSFDQLDELLTVMNEILNYGMLSDALHFGISNPEIGLLPSGRIGISKEFFDQKLQPFYKDNTVANIEAQLETFSDYFETYSNEGKSTSASTFLGEINEAFLHDWRITYTNLNGICLHAAQLA